MSNPIKELNAYTKRWNTSFALVQSMLEDYAESQAKIEKTDPKLIVKRVTERAESILKDLDAK